MALDKSLPTSRTTKNSRVKIAGTPFKPSEFPAWRKKVEASFGRGEAQVQIAANHNPMK